MPPFQSITKRKELHMAYYTQLPMLNLPSH
jgi:hypothetical protein